MGPWAPSMTISRPFPATIAPPSNGSYTLASELVPDAVQGVGYGMPALTYHGRPLISIKRTKTHFGLYPFSASVVSAVSAQLARHVGGKGLDHVPDQRPAIGGVDPSDRDGTA